MSTHEQANEVNPLQDPPEFSLVLGGPLFQLLVRSRLATPALELMHRRIACISLLAWLPLLLLSLLDGKAWTGVGLPFLYDMEMHARFLVALPLLIAAELLVHRRLRLIVGQFVERDIITAAVLPKFKDIIASAMKLRNSVAMELILFILIFVGGYFLWNSMSSLAQIGTQAGTWYATTIDGNSHFSPAGYWYIFVSRPLFQFILVRWYYRLFIWIRFLWQSSRLELNLISTHPDRAAGLGFLGQTSAVFAPLVMAHGALLAGIMANPILFAGAKLTEYKLEIFWAVLFNLAFVLGPLFVFSTGLMRAKRTGLREYGLLANRYVREFDRKWVRGGATEPDVLLGSGDIQSLADLGNSFQVIRDVSPYPFSKDTVIQLIVLTLIPIAPLVLTLIPFEELITKLFGSVF
jgi:hypothetical protein